MIFRCLRLAAILHLPWLSVSPARALSVEPQTLDQQVRRAAAICRATVLGSTSFRSDLDGHIYTRTVLRVDEGLKGKFPERVAVMHRGGRAGDRREFDSAAPRLEPGEESLFYLGQRRDGTLFVMGGGVRRLRTVNARAGADEALLLQMRLAVRASGSAGTDVTAQAEATPRAAPQAAPGLTLRNGVPSRFTAPDRGEALEYLVDADALPDGIEVDAALAAVRRAFAAWSAESSTRFVFGGLVSLGQSAANVNASDGRIRIQLHDLDGFIGDAGLLGRGGNLASISSSFPNGGMGGNVAGTEFFPCLSGYVVINHTKSGLSTLATLEEVVTHEIGHVLGLAHSSESANETDPLLKQATMYFTTHADGRGSTLGAYDPPVIRQVHPQANTPPFGFDRVLDVVTHPSAAPNVPRINRLEVQGFDLQTTDLAVSLTNPTGASGTFSLAGSMLLFTPAAFIGGPRLDPASGSSYRLVFYRLSDGTNSSPFHTVRVISFQPDQNPRGASDGLPDNWVAQYFGSASAAVNPGADADGDGVSNLDEFRLGTDPTDGASVLRITGLAADRLEWLANPHDLYEVQATEDFKSWARVGFPVLPTGTTGSMPGFLNPSRNRLFYRVLRVP